MYNVLRTFKVKFKRSSQINRILAKYQTVNNKSDNLSFVLFFLFFVSISHLTAFCCSVYTGLESVLSA